ncbi:hypothetical protein K0M31_013937 [Melipona bicolor]|uniref:Uncharacterized protein n=1 Tax=Melipona bicolor TaxID=60889 RepID=A0AA40KTW3_9HYME|nr:hypothetical protein K0M31_013937 [Melipona bicolor]
MAATEPRDVHTKYRVIRDYELSAVLFGKLASLILIICFVMYVMINRSSEESQFWKVSQRDIQIVIDK